MESQLVDFNLIYILHKSPVNVAILCKSLRIDSLTLKRAITLKAIRSDLPQLKVLSTTISNRFDYIKVLFV